MTDNTQELDEILDMVFECNSDDETPNDSVRNYRTLVLHDSELQPLQDQAKQSLLDWHNKQIEEVLDRLKVPTINDVFPSKPYDGKNTLKDMVAVVNHYEGLIEAERNKLKEK